MSRRLRRAPEPAAAAAPALPPIAEEKKAVPPPLDQKSETPPPPEIKLAPPPELLHVLVHPPPPEKKDPPVEEKKGPPPKPIPAHSIPVTCPWCNQQRYVRRKDRRIQVAVCLEAEDGCVTMDRMRKVDAEKSVADNPSLGCGKPFARHAHAQPSKCGY